MVKLYSETLEKRDYVDNLEHNDKRLTSKELSEILSDKEKVTIEYIESLGKRVKLDKRIAKILIENWDFEYVAFNLKRFEWLDKEIANLLIDKICWTYVTYNIKLFKWLDKEIAHRLLEDGDYDWVIRYIDNFEWLDEETAELLRNLWHGNVVEKHKERFYKKQ